MVVAMASFETDYRTQHNDTVTTLHYIVFCFIYFLLVSCCSVLCKQTFYELWTMYTWFLPVTQI